MASVIERNECSYCHEPEGLCMCPALAPWVPVRYTNERYLLELLKAARGVLNQMSYLDRPDTDALQAAVVWCESDGLGPVALSGQAQLELGDG